MSPETDKTREVFLTLAEKLPDSLLETWFPDTTPPLIRNLLRRVADAYASTGTGSRERESPPVPAEEKARTGPGPEQCLLYTDGASRGNPGEAGAGIVILDAERCELVARSIYLGRCTNNVAEYRALIAGLETAARLGCRNLRIRLDSELIVRQLQGVYRVKNKNLKLLFAGVGRELKKFSAWNVQHIPRSENMRADELANRAIDEKKAGNG